MKLLSDYLRELKMEVTVEVVCAYSRSEGKLKADQRLPDIKSVCQFQDLVKSWVK